ncbi:MAG TPA: glycosyltransferase [Terriglobia bacterium]|nr:glycosyltransferase [Terriglobia bacterium]
MKVLMISKALVVGAYHGKLRELSRLGVELSVVVPERWGNQRPERVEPDGYELRLLHCRFTGAHHFHYYPAIASVIREGNWDVVHIDEEPFNFVTFHAARVCASAKRRSLFFTWQNLMKAYPPPFGLFERSTFQSASGAVSGNAEATDILQRRGFRKPIEMIPQFGIDPAVFRRQEAGELRRKLGLNGSFAVGFIGRIVPEKGLDTMIKALSLLPPDYTFVPVGSGPYRAELESRVRELGLEKRVRWAPWVNSAEVPEYLNAFDALVLPSRTTRAWKEQFGRALVEAMACETCAVGSDSGEIPNVIGDTGLVFREGDERALAEQLRKLAEDRSLRESIGRRGRKRVLEHYTHAKVARDTARFYEHICGS